MTKPSVDRIIRDSRAGCLVLSQGEAKVMVDEIVLLRDRCQHLQVERDLLAGKLDVAEDALKEIAGRCHNRLATIAEIAAPYQHSSL